MVAAFTASDLNVFVTCSTSLLRLTIPTEPKFCERSHQLGLTVARDPGDADDLSARNVEAYILEFSSAQSLNGQIDFLGNIIGLWRKRRPERATDDHAQQILIGHIDNQRPTA